MQVIWSKLMRKILIGIISLSVLVAVGFFLYKIISYSLLESYTLSKNGQVLKSENGQYYVPDRSFSVAAVSQGGQIGQTENSGAVYEIKGQPRHDWIVYEAQGEMSITQVFHRKQVKPLSPSSKKIVNVRMMETAGIKQALGMGTASSKNRIMLHELAEAIVKKGKVEKVTSDQVMSLQMTFKEYKGLAYVYYVIITDQKKVYLSKVNDNQLIKAGPLLSEWVLHHR
jgi:hypothetical protein